MKSLIVLLLAALFILHQDFWWWDDSDVVLGFLPIGLAWQLLITVGAGIAWWLATRYCWPKDLDAFERAAEENETEGG